MLNQPNGPAAPAAAWQEVSSTCLPWLPPTGTLGLGQGHLWAPGLIKTRNPSGSPSSCWLTDLHRQECHVPRVWLLSSPLLRQRLGICGKCSSGIPLQQLGNWSRWDAADGLRKKCTGVDVRAQWNHCNLVPCLWITEHPAATLGLLHWRGLSLMWRIIKFMGP